MVRRAMWIVGLWLTAHVGLIAGHVLLVFLYSIAIAPGLANAAYTQFAMDSGPWFSIVFGGPVFYAIGRILSTRLAPNGRGAALVVWALYSVTDAAVVLMSSSTLGPWFGAKWVTSQGVKLIAVLLATRRPDGHQGSPASA